MLNKIIKFSLNNKLFVLLGAILLMVGGVYTTQKMDVDVFPDLTAPTVVVMTDAHGMSTEETERLVTFHIETAVNGATDVRRVRSASLQGYSFVWVEFDWGTDIFKARQIVSEKMVTQTAAQALTVPNESVVEEMGNYFVFVQLTPEFFEKRAVSKGVTDGIRTEITAGVSAGDRVVSKGAILVKLAQASGALDAHAGHVH